MTEKPKPVVCKLCLDCKEKCKQIPGAVTLECKHFNRRAKRVKPKTTKPPGRPLRSPGPSSQLRLVL